MTRAAGTAEPPVRLVPAAGGRAAGQEPSPARRAAILAACCSALFLTGLDNTIVNVGLPAIGASLHATVAGLQWTIAGYTVALASLLMVAGSAADRFGRRAVFQAGLALFIGGSWLCSIAPGLGWLVAFRVVQGAGAAALNPSALGIIADAFPRPADRARAIGTWDGVLGVSMALGPVAGGVLVGLAGWRGIFWANIPAGLAAVAMTALLVPESRAPRARLPDPVGQALVIAVLGTAAYGIIEAPSCGWLSPRALACWMTAEAALALLLAWEARREEPLIDLRLFRSVPFAGAALTGTCAICAVSGFLFLTSLYLQDVRGFSALGAGLAILPMPVAMAACAPLAGRVIARRGTRIPLLAAGVALTLSCAMLSRLTSSSGTAFLVLAYAAFGAGAGLASPAITGGVMAGAPPSQASLASGINSSARMVGQSLGVAVTGSLLAGSLHGTMRAGFLGAARPGWQVMSGCGYAVLVLGLVTTSRWARATAARAGAGQEAA